MRDSPPEYVKKLIRLEGRVNTVERDLSRVCKVVELVDEKQDELTLNTHRNKWVTATIVAGLSIIGNAIVLPLVLKTLLEGGF